MFSKELAVWHTICFMTIFKIDGNGRPWEPINRLCRPRIQSTGTNFLCLSWKRFGILISSVRRLLTQFSRRSFWNRCTSRPSSLPGSGDSDFPGLLRKRLESLCPRALKLFARQRFRYLSRPRGSSGSGENGLTFSLLSHEGELRKNNFYRHSNRLFVLQSLGKLKVH